MGSDPVIRSQLVPMMLARAETLGLSVSTLEQRFRLPGARLAREVEVELRVIEELGDALAKATGDPFFGLNTARAAPRGAYGLLEFDIRSAPNVREALSRLMRYSALANHLVRYQLAEHGAEVDFEQRIVGRAVGLGRQGNELAAGLIVRIARECIGPEWTPARVWFSHAAPDDRSALIDFFGTSAIEFSRVSNGFTFAGQDLERRLSSADSALLSVLDEQAERLARERARPVSSVSERVTELLREKLSQQPRVEAIAEALHMSPRTLQRRLENEGVEFQTMLDDVRRKLAREHLAREHLSLTEIAFLLGYSDPRAFNRAFRRWTGRTPSAHRRAARSTRTRAK